MVRKGTPDQPGRGEPDRPGDADNVVGVGIGFKQVRDRLTPTLCLRIYVKRKFPAAVIPSRYRLPYEVNGVATDVIAIGGLWASQGLPQCSILRQVWQKRPVACGISTGHYQTTMGTLGARVTHKPSGQTCLLSCSHVLTHHQQAQVGHLVLQPGPADGGAPGNPGHHIGHLLDWVPIDLSGLPNRVDCAIASTGRNRVQRIICSIGSVHGARTAQRGLLVQKHGRTTGHTWGLVTDTNATIYVNYGPAALACFVHQIAIQAEGAFSVPGDSGAVVLDVKHRACGLLFTAADEENIAFANPVRAVLQKLHIQFD